jgi:hypothetical protein
MNTAIVEYNANNVVAIGLLDVLNKVKGVKVNINYILPEEEKCPYSKSFMEEIEKSKEQFENGEFVRIDRKTLWT